jgi:branched-chain amino acid transport system ATP-binding protein
MTTTNAAPPVLRVRNLDRRFGGVSAVHNVSLDVGAGERHAVLGPNGAGTSTLFNLITGADRPTSGNIELFGADVTALGAHRRARLGMSRTFQTSRLLVGLSVADNLFVAGIGAAGGRLRLVRTGRDSTMRWRAEQVAQSLGLFARLDAPAGELSHGEQRQLEIGLALMAQPRILLLDEPAAGLSRAERQLLTSLLLSLDRDVTLLIIEHDMDVALTVAEAVTVMHDGAVIVEGTPAQIRASQLVHDLYLGRAHG